MCRCCWLTARSVVIAVPSVIMTQDRALQPLASLGHPGRRRVVLGHTLNTLQHVITKTSHNVLREFLFCVGPRSQPSWATRGPWAVGWTPLLEQSSIHRVLFLRVACLGVFAKHESQYVLRGVLLTSASCQALYPNACPLFMRDHSGFYIPCSFATYSYLILLPVCIKTKNKKVIIILY